MAETVKITKAPAKPRKTVAKKKTAAQAAMPAMPSREEIERLARSCWAQRGFQDGYAGAGLAAGRAGTAEDGLVSKSRRA